MRALVTNDGGIDSAGLVVLAEAGIDAGLGVTVAAPTWDSTGADRRDRRSSRVDLPC